MATLTPRQPFAVLDESRLQALTSIKNRQNNIFAANASLKPTPSSAPSKRRLASDLLTDELDSENLDPSAIELPSKRAKNLEGTPTKVSKFTLLTTPKTEPVTSSLKFSSSLSVSIPPTTTPISHSRGSPKNRRIAQLSNKRLSRSGGTPSFKRINPPTKPSTTVPFSLDAALQGTISSYTPTQPSALSTVSAASSLTPPRKSKKSQPESWFFDIHEDTPDQESTNFLLHNASTLDISSDDDAASLRAKLAAEHGKENVPPMGWDGPLSRAARARLDAEGGSMDVERNALKEMDVKSFWPEGKEELVVIVDEKEEDEENTIPQQQVSAKKEAEVIICVDPVQDIPAL